MADELDDSDVTDADRARARLLWRAARWADEVDGEDVVAIALAEGRRAGGREVRSGVDELAQAVRLLRDRGMPGAVVDDVEVQMTRALAEVRAAGVAEGRAPFERLFGSGQGAACRTTYRDEPVGEGLFVTAECVEVPVEDLRDAFGGAL